MSAKMSNKHSFGVWSECVCVYVSERASEREKSKALSRQLSKGMSVQLPFDSFIVEIKLKGRPPSPVRQTLCRVPAFRQMPLSVLFAATHTHTHTAHTVRIC